MGSFKICYNCGDKIDARGLAAHLKKCQETPPQPSFDLMSFLGLRMDQNPVWTVVSFVF